MHSVLLLTCLTLNQSDPEIASQLEAIRVDIKRSLELTQKNYEQIQANQTLMTVALLGDMTDEGKIGLIARMRILEFYQLIQVWFLGLMLTIMVGITVTVSSAAMIKRFKLNNRNNLKASPK